MRRGPTHGFLKICMLACPLLLFATAIQAQDARVYLNTPRGTSIFQFNVIDSNSSTDDEDGLENQVTDSKTYLTNYIYAMEGLFGRTASLGITAPIVDYFSYDSATDSILNNMSGLGDIGITIDHNFYGGMSMDKKVFAETPPCNYGGIHMVLSTPTGAYDPSNTTNIGSNRFSLKVLLQQSFILNKATAWLDLYASSTFFWDNDEYQGSNTLSQNAQFKLYSYYSQNIGSPRTWVELGMVYTNGGAIYVDGIEQASNQSTLQGALGLSATIWKRGTLRTLYMPTLYENRDNFHKGYSLQLRYQQLF